MAEVIEKRTRSSKTHWLGNNNYSWDGTIGAIHYEDSGWQEIDSYFEPATAPWDWQMVKAGYHIKVKEDFTAGQIIEFEKQGETLQFQPMALEWTNDLDQIQPIAMPHKVIPSITNPEVDLLPAVGMLSHQGTIRWNDAYGEGLDFEWRCTSTRLAKILEIESLSKLPNPEQFILDGGNPVLRLNLIFDPPAKQDVDILVDGQVWDRLSTKGSRKSFTSSVNRENPPFSVIEFVKDGETLWGFMPLRYWGSGEGEENEGQSITTLEKRGDKLYISVRVPYEWLQGTVYPVFIDTDVDEQVGASSDDIYIYTTSSDLTGTVLSVGKGIFNTYSHGVRFTTVDIPQGATIDVAHLTYTSQDSQSGVTCNWDIGGFDEDDTATFSTYADWNGRAITAITNWDNVGAWVTDTEYQTPSIVTPVQAIVNRVSWAANNAMGFRADNDASSLNAIRRSHSYDGSTTLCPKLHIEYSAGGFAHSQACIIG